MHRFGNQKALCKYAGLVPRVMQSRESNRRGRLVKQSSATLRTTRIRSAHEVILAKYDNKLKTFFLRFARRKKFKRQLQHSQTRCRTSSGSRPPTTKDSVMAESKLWSSGSGTPSLNMGLWTGVIE